MTYDIIIQFNYFYFERELIASFVLKWMVKIIMKSITIKKQFRYFNSRLPMEQISHTNSLLGSLKLIKTDTIRFAIDQWEIFISFRLQLIFVHVWIIMSSLINLLNLTSSLRLTCRSIDVNAEGSTMYVMQRKHLLGIF